jgi:hypothetical protein
MLLPDSKSKMNHVFTQAFLAKQINNLLLLAQGIIEAGFLPVLSQATL